MIVRSQHESTSAGAGRFMEMGSELVVTGYCTLSDQAEVLPDSKPSAKIFVEKI